MKHFKSNIIEAAIVAALVCAPVADAAIYFRGKEVLQGAKPVVDVERFFWAPLKDSANTDRIQGHIDINGDNKIHSVILVVQVFNSRGELKSSFSITPRTCEIHPCYGRCSDFYPFCGVRYSRPKAEPWFKKTECYKKGEIAWFYVDFPRDRDYSTMRVVNAIVDGNEVQYNIRYVANKLLRYNLQPPEIKHGTKAELGDASECTGWLPQMPDDIVSPLKSDNDGERSVSRRLGSDKAKQELRGANPEDDGVSNAAVVQVEPLRLDVSPLVALRSSFTGKAFRCKEHLDNFTATIELAESEANGKRVKIDRSVSKSLEKLLEKAQSENDAKLASSIKTALSALPEEINDGGSSEVSKVFQARYRHFEQINKELAKSALASAKILFSKLEGERNAWTKKGESDVAKSISDFQKTLSEWVKELKSKVTANAQPQVQTGSCTF